MSLQVAHLENGRGEIQLAPDTPPSVRSALDTPYVRVLVLPQRFLTTDLTAAEAEGFAMWSFLSMGFGEDRQSIHGYGLPWLLGDDDHGVLWAGAASSQAGWTFDQHLDEWVFGGTGVDRGNGLTKGTTPGSGTTYTVRFRPGQTPRQTMAFLCARSGNEWRANPDASIDFESAANLFRTGAVILADHGGREGDLVSLDADLSLDGTTVENVVSKQLVDWQGDGTSLGEADNTLDASWDAPDGDAIQNRNYQSGTPKMQLRDPDDVDKVAAWLNANQTAAGVQAQKMANQKALRRRTITAEIDIHDPLSIVYPGDTVYAWNQRLGIYDTANPLPYRGRYAFGEEIRCVSAEVPCRAEYGYMTLSGGGDLYDFTRWVEPEDRTCVLELGVRGRYTRRRAHRRKVNRPANRRKARLYVYLNRRQAA